MSNGVQLVSDAGGGSLTVNNASNSTLQALGIADFDVTKDFVSARFESLRIELLARRPSSRILCKQLTMLWHKSTATAALLAHRNDR